MPAPQNVRAQGLLERLQDAVRQLQVQIDELMEDPSRVDDLRWVEYTEQAGYGVSSLADEFCDSDYTEAYFEPDE